MSSVVMRKKWEARLNTRISGPATKWPPRRSCTCAGGPAHHVANSAGKCCNKNVVNDSVRIRSASERLDEMCGRVGTFSQNNHEKAGRSFTTNCSASCNVSDRDFRVYKNEMGAMPASDYIRWVRSQASEKQLCLVDPYYIWNNYILPTFDILEQLKIFFEWIGSTHETLVENGFFTQQDSDNFFNENTPKLATFIIPLIVDVINIKSFKDAGGSLQEKRNQLIDLRQRITTFFMDPTYFKHIMKDVPATMTSIIEVLEKINQKQNIPQLTDAEKTDFTTRINELSNDMDEFNFNSFEEFIGTDLINKIEEKLELIQGQLNKIAQPPP